MRRSALVGSLFSAVFAMAVAGVEPGRVQTLPNESKPHPWAACIPTERGHTCIPDGALERVSISTAGAGSPHCDTTFLGGPEDSFADPLVWSEGVPDGATIACFPPQEARTGTRTAQSAALHVVEAATAVGTWPRDAAVASVTDVTDTRILYRNEAVPVQAIRVPGAGVRMADDLVLAVTEDASVTGYEVAVFGLGETGETFDVSVSLCESDPCPLCGSVVPGSGAFFSGVPNDGATVRILRVDLPERQPVPAKLWLSVTFSTDDAGWVVAELPQDGITADFWSEPNDNNECTLISFASSENLYGGFHAVLEGTVGRNPEGACCLGATCVFTDRFDCKLSGGYFVEDAIGCEFGDPCGQGACCRPTPSCTDDDGSGGRMDPELCDIIGGSYVGGALCDDTDPCQVFRLPDGFEIVEAAPGTEDFKRRHPNMNECGEIVFHLLFETPFGSRFDVFHYDNGRLSAVTSTQEVSDAFPDINDRGSITWGRGVPSLNTSEVALLRDGSVTSLAFADGPLSPELNNIEHTTWKINLQNCPPKRVDAAMLYDGVSVRELLNDGLANQEPVINNDDIVVGSRKDFPCPGGPADWTADILESNGGSIFPLPAVLSQVQGPTLNDGSLRAWRGTDGEPRVEVFENGESRLLPARACCGGLNNNEDIVYNWGTLHTPWQIRLERGGTTYHLSIEKDIDNSVDNSVGTPNDAGEIAWKWNPNGGFVPSGIRYMRRIRDGDVNFDDVVDLDDVIPMPGCYTGPGDTDRLCECRFFDLDHDRDVDQDDLDLLLRSYTGPLEDCNDNGALDFDELLDSTANDCNLNARPDGCDIADGTSTDADADGLPDECCSPVAPLPGDNLGIKNRYLSIQTAGAADQTPGVPVSPQAEFAPPQAIRVTLSDLPEPFDGFNGQQLWVGPPREVCENASQGFGTDPSTCSATGGPPRQFTAATLQCEPHYADWDAVGTVYVYHELIVPGGSYAAEVINESCALTTAGNFSAGLSVPTARWADLVGGCGGTVCEPPNGSVDVQDVLGLLDKFAGRPGAPIKPRADLAPGQPDARINVLDIALTLDAFTGTSYPFPPPTPPCP